MEYRVLNQLFVLMLGIVENVWAFNIEKENHKKKYFTDLFDPVFYNYIRIFMCYPLINYLTNTFNFALCMDS